MASSVNLESFIRPLLQEKIEETKDLFQKNPEGFNRLCIAVTNLFSSRLSSTELSPPDLDTLQERVSSTMDPLLRLKIPFEAISMLFLEKVLAISDQADSDPDSALEKLLENEDLLLQPPFKQDFEKMIGAVPSETLGRNLNVLYQKALKQDPHASCQFFILFDVIFQNPEPRLSLDEVCKQLQTQQSQKLIADHIKKRFDSPQFLSSLSPKMIEVTFYFSSLFSFRELPFFEFFQKASQSLKDIPFEVWPKKNEILRHWLRKNADDMLGEFRISRYCGFTNERLATLLAQSDDPRTKEIGNCLLTSFNPETAPLDRAACFNRQQEIFPLGGCDFQEIFGFLHTPYGRNPEDNPRTQDTVFVKNLSMFVKHMHSRCSRHGDPYLDSLVAYDKKTETILWEFRLNEVYEKRCPRGELFQYGISFLCYQTISLGIVFLKKEDQELYVLNPENGTLIQKIHLPHVPEEIWLTQFGFCYYWITEGNESKLFGKCIFPEGEFFQIPAPLGRLSQCGPFARIDSSRESRQYILDSTGKITEISDCLSVEIKKRKLYMIKKNPTQPEQRFLSIRSLESEQTFSLPDSEEKRIPLPPDALEISCVYDGKLRYELEDQSWVLIDLSKF